MHPEEFLKGRVKLYGADCLEVLAQLPENSIDSCVVDPPYHLTSIVKRFGSDGAAPAKSAAQRRFEKTGGADRKPGTDQYGRLSRGFMGKVWDGGDIAFRPETWAAVMRVLKPGGHLVAFGAPKNSHRLTCAIEDAGFEIRDMIAWLFGSGFPKSHDVSKGIDRAAGAEREAISTGKAVKRMIPGADQNKAGWEKNNGREYVPGVTTPATPAAQEWEGWGTALKPAIEPITLARKPLSEKTVAANVLRWRTGALNIDACRIESTDSQLAEKYASVQKAGPRENSVYGNDSGDRAGAAPHRNGRWPANVAHDNSDQVIKAFPSEAGGNDNRVGIDPGKRPSGFGNVGNDSGGSVPNGTLYGDNGSASRFFYSAKADSEDRIGSKHPTVKPVDLVRWLVRMVTPPGGTVIDPFAGTGTLGEAAWLEGAYSILIEREPEYQSDIRRRMKLCLAGPEEKARESIKAKLSGKPQNHGPLFGGTE